MKSKEFFTKTEANEIIKLIEEKLKASPTKQKVIRNRIRKLGFYATDYGFRDGYTVAQFKSVAKIDGIESAAINKINSNTISSSIKNIPTTTKSRTNSDESYIIDLCDEVLKQLAIRQHRFSFLKGDSGTRLPVDSYYPELNLVIEFKEKQHTEEVNFFDRRQTVSGVGRGEQRKIYDQRRRDVLPEHGITLLELDYSYFQHSSNKKLIRNREADLIVILQKLNQMKLIS